MSGKETKNTQKHEKAMARFKKLKQQQQNEEAPSEQDDDQGAGVLPDKNLKRNLGCG